jgi:hypothetical protein
VECLAIGLVLMAAAIVVLVVAAARAQTHADVWNQAFSHVARRYGGHLSLGGWFGQPQWRLQYGPVYVRLATYQHGGRRGARIMELMAQFPEAQRRCEVVSKSTGPALFVLASDLIPLDWPRDDFSLRWDVRADDPDEARMLLSTSVRYHLDQIRRTPDWADTSLSVHPGWLILRRRWTSTRPADLVAFVDLALGLVDQLQLTRTVGIDFVDEGQVKVIEQARCLVCGEILVHEIVYCRRCKTPHHRECWEYTGACSTYGCRETQYLVPQQLPAARSVGDEGSEPLWPRPGKPR